MADEKRPSPSLVGSGMANYAARLAELRRKQKEAIKNDNWALVDSIEAQIRKLEQEQANSRRQ